MAKDTGETATATTDDKFLMLLEVLSKQQAGVTAEALREILAANATSVQKAMRPENDTHPGISAFSHPDGDHAHPKPPLPFEFYFNQYPVHKFPETETWDEWALAAQVVPGTYTVIRNDLSKMTVEVKGERNADGQITKMEVIFPVLRSEQSLVPPREVFLYQLIHNENPKQAYLEAMQRRLTRMAGSSLVGV